jgi:hypothetical protein
MEGLASRAVEYLKKRESLTVDSQEQVDDLLQTPLTEIKKPILIESGYLKDRFYLVANDAQAREIEEKGGVCYLPGEVKTLLARSNGMDEEILKDYLRKFHAVKTTFPGARIQWDTKVCLSQNFQR